MKILRSGAALGASYAVRTEDGLGEESHEKESGSEPEPTWLCVLPDLHAYGGGGLDAERQEVVRAPWAEVPAVRLLAGCGLCTSTASGRMIPAAEQMDQVLVYIRVRKSNEA